MKKLLIIERLLTIALMFFIVINTVLIISFNDKLNKVKTLIESEIKLTPDEIKALKHLLEEREQTQLDISTVLEGYGR